MLYCKDFRIYDDRDKEEHSVIIGCNKKKEIKIINKNVNIPEKLAFETPIEEDREPVIINLKLPTPEPNEPSVPQKEEPVVEEPVVEEPVVEESQKNTTKSLFSLDDVDLNFVGDLVSGGFL